jgi:hypothetical protein
MSRSWINHALTVLTLLALAMPLAARNSAGKDSKPIASTTVDLVDDATIGGKQVKAGTYDVKATQSTLSLLHNGKVVAESPIEWKDGSSKEQYSSVTSDSGAMKEVHFAGKARYAEIAADSTTTSTGQK